jgi:hypothetical protein
MFDIQTIAAVPNVTVSPMDGMTETDVSDVWLRLLSEIIIFQIAIEFLFTFNTEANIVVSTARTGGNKQY